MKKNKMMRLAAVLLVMTMLTTCAISGTFAKYTSTVTGSDTATVAKWSFSQVVVGSDIELVVSGNAETVTFNLFDTINDTKDNADEEDVADDKIAPGTTGSFQLELKNTSEVTADYEITLAHENPSNIPLEYSVDGGTNWSYDIASLKIEGDDIVIGGTANPTVLWRWQYGDVAALKNDATDTALGIAAQTAAPEITVTATLNVWQVD